MRNPNDPGMPLPLQFKWAFTYSMCEFGGEAQPLHKIFHSNVVNVNDTNMIFFLLPSPSPSSYVFLLLEKSFNVVHIIVAIIMYQKNVRRHTHTVVHTLIFKHKNQIYPIPTYVCVIALSAHHNWLVVGTQKEIESVDRFMFLFLFRSNFFIASNEVKYIAYRRGCNYLKIAILFDSFFLAMILS